MRSDGRANDQLRPIQITRGFTKTPAGSVLWQQGGTIVLCTASVTPQRPPWMKMDKPGGWVTSTYVMVPGSTPQRKDWPRSGHTDSRGTEIERLIGRALRAVVNLDRVGPNTINLDCQVLQADGGTRTACISAAYVALADAISKLPAQLASTLKPEELAANQPVYSPATALADQLAAVSVGIVEGEVRLDLDYYDDSRALVDLNVAYTSSGKYVELQGSAENGGSFDRKLTDAMLDLAEKGCREIFGRQNDALSTRAETKQ